MSDSYFQRSAGGYVPAPWAHGPWADDMMHGRLLGGLAALGIEEDFGADGWRVARLTVDLFRPAAMKPVQVETAPVRQGRRIQVVDALMTCDGHEVGRATAVLLTTGEEPPGNIWRPPPTQWPEPESVDEPPEGQAPSGAERWKWRLVQGGFGAAAQSRVWTNETGTLVDGEPLTPFVRAALSGDIACPLANSSDEGLHYINADYTMLIARYPVGEWVGIEVSGQLAADGISIGSATLVDRDGPFATSGGTSLARPPLDAPGEQR